MGKPRVTSFRLSALDSKPLANVRSTECCLISTVSFPQVSEHQRPILQRYKRLAIQREKELNAERQRQLNELRHYVEARLHQLEARANVEMD